MSARDIVVYGDINLNIMDGSAAWLASLAETLSLTDSTVHVVLKATRHTDRLLTRLTALRNVTIHEATPAPGTEVMSHPVAIARLEEVVEATGSSVVIIRGRELCDAAGQSSLAPRLWSYVTDFTFPVTDLPEGQLPQLRRIAANSARVFMQTEDARSYFESIVPEAAGKTLLMTPTVPDDFFVELHDRQRDDDTLRLVYAGKFHPDWRTLEMLELPGRLDAAGVPTRLTMLGDKISAPDAGWMEAMRAGLEATDGPTWLGGLPREAAVAEIGRQDVGLSWRSTRLDSSLELSTKLLEYAAAGAPPLLNRTPAHEALLGDDYPLFIDRDDADVVVAVLAAGVRQLPLARSRAQAAARAYSSSATAARLEGYFAAATTGPRATTAADLDRPKRTDAAHTVALLGPLSDRSGWVLDLLERLVALDERFRLVITGQLPWAEDASAEPEQGAIGFLAHAGTAQLRERVVFAELGADLANSLRGFGWLIAPPGTTVAPLVAEGAASGTTPVLLTGLPHAPELAEFGFDDTAAAAAAMTSIADNPDLWAAQQQRAHELAELLGSRPIAVGRPGHTRRPVQGASRA